MNLAGPAATRGLNARLLVLAAARVGGNRLRQRPRSGARLPECDDPYDYVKPFIREASLLVEENCETILRVADTPNDRGYLT